MSEMRPQKTVKCKMCSSRFDKKSMAHVCCSPLCAIQWGKKERARKARKADLEAARAVKLDKKVSKARVEELKPLSYWLAKAQTAVNKYVRLRDVNYGCISCNKPATWGGQWHAGHYRSVGSNTYLRFHLWNINKQCVQCNHFLGGNVGKYRDGLIERKGRDVTDFLETSTNTRRFTREYLERLTAIFTKKAKRIQEKLSRG